VPAVLAIPTDAAADALDAWCWAHGFDAARLLDPPPGQAPARLWRQDDWLWWTVPMPDGSEVIVPAGCRGPA